MIELEGTHLTIADVISVSRDYEQIQLSERAKQRMNQSQQLVMDLLHSDKTVYGINTGFGSLSTEKIDPKDVEQLQINLIRSHCCGIGKPLPTEVVRAMMLLRANSLAKGYSGIRTIVVQLLIDMLNTRIHPLVPSKGSIGASGDLIPLAHIAQCLIGEGTVIYHDKTIPSTDAFKQNRLTPVTLIAKEGLALINGTQLMSALGCLSIWDAEILLKQAQIAGAMSLEALKGTNQAFRKEIQQLRPHPGQINCAENLWNLTENSEIIRSHQHCEKVQDAYSLRCMPQVFGASKDVINNVKKTLGIEINSATDNPLLFPEEKESLSGGNFHGQALAFSLDFLSIAVSELGNFSERRIARLIDANLSDLPAFLTEKHGLHSGLMLPQYAAAALVNENKTLCHPNSTDSIPSSANKEDHVSMGANAGLKLPTIIENVQTIIAIELLTAAQGLEFRKPLTSSSAIQTAYDLIRKQVPKIESDRALQEDIKTIIHLLQHQKIINAVEKQIGSLQ